MKIIIVILLSIMLNSCLTRAKHISHESGIIIGKQYSPELNTTVCGNGVDMKGNIIFTTHNIHEDQQFNVIFKCEHGVVSVVNDINVYSKVKEGDTVIIDYYNMLNKKGEVKDFDFIDCNKINSH